MRLSKLPYSIKNTHSRTLNFYPQPFTTQSQPPHHTSSSPLKTSQENLEMSQHTFTGSPAGGQPPNVPFQAAQPGFNTDEGTTTTATSELSTEDDDDSRFELFLLGDGQKKVTETPDTRESFPSPFLFLVAYFCCVEFHSLHSLHSLHTLHTLNSTHPTHFPTSTPNHNALPQAPTSRTQLPTQPN